MVKKKLTIFDSLSFKDFTYDNKSSSDDNKIRKEITTSLEKTIMNTYKYSEKCIELYKFIAEYDQISFDELSIKKATEIYKKYEKDIKMPVEIAMDGNAVKVIIKSINSRFYIKGMNTAVGYFQNKWKTDIGDALHAFCKQHKLRYDKVYVLVKMYVPIQNYDYDFDAFKSIFDALAYSGIILTDDCNALKFGIEQFAEAENIRTEIYIYGNGNIPKKIDDITKIIQ